MQEIEKRTHTMIPILEARLLPVPSEITARHSVDDHRGLLGIRAAVYGGVRRTVDWIVGGDLSDRGGISCPVWNVSRVVRPVDGEVTDEAVTAYRWNEGEGKR